MKSVITILLCILILAPSIRAEDWSLQIETPPSNRNPKEVCVLSRYSFRVILTNTSDHDLKIWNQNCSEGYSNLGFKVTLADGKEINVGRLQDVWLLNIIKAVLYKPGAQMIWDVNLDEQKTNGWKPSPSEWGQKANSICAIFTSPKNNRELVKDVWHGSVTSPNVLFNFSNTQ